MPAVRGILRAPALRFSLAVAIALVLGATWGGAPPLVEATNVPEVVAKIAVGTNPVGVAVNSVTNRVYVANESSDNVSVLDGATGNILATVTVGDRPIGVDVNTTTNRIFVSNYNGSSVTVIDGATNGVITTIPVVATPQGLAVNSFTNRVYVGQSLGNTLTVIDGTSNTVLTTLMVGAEGTSVAVNVSTNRVFVSNGNSNNVSVIDGATNTEIDTDGNAGNGMTRIAVGADPVGLAVDETTNRVYVSIWSSFGGTNVTVIDGATYGIIANAPVASGPRDVDVHPAIDRAYAASDNGSAGNVTVIDTNTNLQLATIPIAGGGLGPHGIAVNTVTNRVYVTVRSTNQVWVISDPTSTLGSSLISFQGRLTDSTGTPLPNGNYSVAFRVYDAPAGGNQKWTETQTVAVSSSVFSVYLGSVNPLEAVHFSGEPRYLEVQVASDPPLIPRQRFTSVPYAFNSQTLDGMGVEEMLSRDGIVLLVAGAQPCPAGFTILMDIDAGVNGTGATRGCSSTAYTQVFYIGSTQTCPVGWTQADINAAVNGTVASDACYR